MSVLDTLYFAGISGLNLAEAAFQSILVAFKHVKQLGEHLFFSSARALIMSLPLKLRCICVRTVMCMNYMTSRKILYFIMRPYGYQWDWVSPAIKRDTWSGRWIFPNVRNHEHSVKHAEATASDADLVIMYIHGGGFALGTCTSYMDSFIYILERLQETHGLDARMFTINYRLIPEYPWPHGQDDCVKAYRYLLDLGVKPSRIIMAGDSAGANLVSTSTLAIRDQKLPLPHGHVLISPWVTLEADSPTFTTNAATDCIARDLVAIKGPEAYLPQLKLLDDKARQRLLQNPRISPLYANLKGICPTLVSYGGLEIFQHDIEAFVRRLKENHVDVEVLTRPDVPHIWVIEALMSPSYSIWEEDCGRIVDWCANRVK